MFMLWPVMCRWQRANFMMLMMMFMRKFMMKNFIDEFVM